MGPPPRRQTVEVHLSWLEEDPTPTEARPALRPAELQPEPGDGEHEASSTHAPPLPPPPSSRKRPPRLPGAARTLPPMPVPSTTEKPPPRRHATMEVEMSWLELVDDKAGAPSPRATKRPSGTSSRPPRGATSRRPPPRG
ncbi:MAG: hypothetical protein KF850_06515 [Labilithrix sp.]|nr:hypothetical protein [Labilithrix sp.]MBX3211667.1 hypothetical protein [Labilithrix sp.]